MFGIVPQASRTFRSGTNVAPLVGRGRGPTRECPGRIGPGAQGPIGPAVQALGETLGRDSRRGGGNLPPTPSPWPPALGLEEGQGPVAHPSIYRGMGRTTPPHLLLNPRRPASLLSLFLQTARRRSPAAETLHHLHHAVVL